MSITIQHGRPIVREKLTADRTYYVRTDGNDSNTGLADTSGAALLTVQAAWNKLLTIDCNGYLPTIQIADGTYNDGTITLSGIVLGAPYVLINGNVSTPANVILQATGTLFSLEMLGLIQFKAVTLRATLIALNMNSPGGKIEIGAGVIFDGTATFAHINAGAGRVNVAGNFTIASSCSAWLRVQLNGTFYIGAYTITFSGTPAWSTAGIMAYSGGSALFSGSAVISGAATGKRYDVTLNGVINTSGGGASYFPGNSAGTTATGGQYA